MNFFRTLVAFRNAIERLRILRGSVDDPNQVSWWWGFGYLGTPRADIGGGDGGGEWHEPEDLPGSPVPRRPYPGSGSAAAEVEEEGDEVDVTSAPESQIA
jgi:hypothetical protein